MLVHLESDLLLKPLEDIEPIGDWTKALDKVAELRISHQRLVVMQDECDHDWYGPKCRKCGKVKV